MAKNYLEGLEDSGRSSQAFEYTYAQKNWSSSSSASAGQGGHSILLNDKFEVRVYISNEHLKQAQLLSQDGWTLVPGEDVHLTKEVNSQDFEVPVGIEIQSVSIKFILLDYTGEIGQWQGDNANIRVEKIPPKHGFDTVEVTISGHDGRSIFTSFNKFASKF